MHSDTLDMDISFDIPVRRPALLNKNVRRTGMMDTKVLI